MPLGHAPFSTLQEGFAASVEAYPTRSALEVGGDVFTYAQLSSCAAQLARCLREHDPAPANSLAAFLAYRSPTAYTAILGILGAGKGYVPLHPGFPIDRSALMLEHSGVDLLVVGPEAIEVLRGLLARAKPLTVILDGGSDVGSLAGSFPAHRFVAFNREKRDEPFESPAGVSPDSTAYLLFTSGTTGVPKGVPVSQRNVTSYLHYVLKRYGIGPDDRCSQMFDMTFDLSVHDLFATWIAGACLCSVPEHSMMAPAKFIRERRLSTWFSVPSVIAFLDRLRMLKPEAFPEIRLSLFCGEPLLLNMAEAWRRAAPNSRVENIYGPTEATIAISHFRFDRETSLADRCVNGVVPIGDVFSTQSACVVGADGTLAPPGDAGELCLSGFQVTSGYLNDVVTTQEQFVEIPGQGDRTWYRTGDLVRRDESGCFYYLGRVDTQVQVRGHRVELQEVDHVLREASGTDWAVSVAWPSGGQQVDAIYAFLGDEDGLDPQEILRRCQRALPDYAVPRDVYVVDKLPLNANGKIDRPALQRRLEEALDDPLR